MPKTTTSAEVPASLEQADQAVIEAEQALAALEVQRAGGDPGITPQLLAEANQAAYLARLARDEAVQRATLAEQGRAERCRADARTAAQELLAEHSVDLVGQQWATARRELLALVDAVTARNDAIHHAGGRLAAGYWPRGGSETDGDTLVGVVPSWLRLDGAEHETVSSGDVLIRLLHSVAVQRGGLPSSRYTSVSTLLDGRASDSPAVTAIESAGRAA